MKIDVEKLKTLVATTGWTLKEFAARCGLSACTLSRIFHGKQNLSFKTVGRLCRTLGVNPADII